MRIYPKQSMNVHRVPRGEAARDETWTQPTLARPEKLSGFKQAMSVRGATAPIDEIDWRAVAQRQQADMDNFRRRQMRRADEAIANERERLLTLILPVADNLARALAHTDQNGGALQQGLELTYRELLRLLEAEGVTRLETVGQQFNPDWHEAVATQPTDVESNTIIEEIEAGFKLEDKLLRPARVVVAA